jgi:IS605 OrfB family transposase
MMKESKEHSGMIRAHKIRLHPTPEQAIYFAKAAGTARFVFNWARAEWQRQYEDGGKPSALKLKKQFNIACLRHDLLHKLTTEVAKTASLVAVEDLHVKGLMRNRCLSRSFSDAALGKLLDLLENKVRHAGGTLIKVDRFYPSSQLCHCCGARREDLQLSDREYACPACGYVGDRDENASWNILQEALRLVGT